MQTSWRPHGLVYEHNDTLDSKLAKCADHCDVDKGETTQQEREPAGMPESPLTGKTSLSSCPQYHGCSPTCHQQAEFSLEEVSKISPFTTSAHAENDVSSNKVAETSSDLHVVMDGYQAKRLKESLVQVAPDKIQRTCQLANQGVPDPKTEEKFLGSPLAQAVRFISSHVTDMLLLMSLTLLRREASDCSGYPENAQQLLNAVDAVGSEDSISAKKLREGLSAICSGCVKRNAHTPLRHRESSLGEDCRCLSGVCDQLHDPDSKTIIAEATSVAEQYQEYIERCEDLLTLSTEKPELTDHHNSASEQISEILEVTQPITNENAQLTEDRNDAKGEIHPTDNLSCTEEEQLLLTEDHTRADETPSKDSSEAKEEQTEDRNAAKRMAAARYKVLVAENRRLKRRQLCRQCRKTPANATLLPCGHLVYCLDCAQSLTKCGVCNKEILGDVKTFLS